MTPLGLLDIVNQILDQSKALHDMAEELQQAADKIMKQVQPSASEAAGRSCSEGARKERLLEELGFRYGYEIMCYANRDTKQCVSVEFVAATESEALRQAVSPPPTGGRHLRGWRFYFARETTGNILGQLVDKLESR